MTMTQKDRWAAKSARYAAWAEAADKKAAQLGTRPDYARDHAFLTQPGHIPARAALIARDQRAHEESQKAASHRAKAVNLAAMANRTKGGAERAREASRAVPVQVGSLVSSIYGARRVTKVNAKSVKLENMSSSIDRSLIKVLEF